MTQPHQPARRPGHLDRRGFLRASAALAGTLGLSACGPVIGGATENSLRYWNLFGGGDGPRMLAMEAEYQKAYPAVDYQRVQLQWGPPYYTKVALAAAGGRAPDVAIMHLSRVPGFAPGSLLDPFDLDLLAEAGLREEDFEPRLWERAVVDGELYAIPLDSHPLVLFYNTDICERAGLLDGDGKLVELEGKEALLEAFHAAADAGGKIGLSVENGGATAYRAWWSFYRQADGQIELPVGGEIGMDEDKMTQVLEYLHSWIATGAASPATDYLGSVAQFATGNAGFHLNGEWEITTFQDAGTPFSMAPLPNVFGTSRTQGDAHTFVLPHQRDRDPERTRTSYEFIAHLLKNSLTWAEGGHIPAYLPVFDSPEYQALEPQNEYRASAEVMELDPPAWFTGSAAEYSNQVTAAFLPVYQGAATPEQGIAQFRSAINKLLKTPSPV